MEVALVVFVGCHLYRHILHNLESVALQPDTFDGVVREKFNLAHAQCAQNLCAHAVIAKVGVESEVDIGVHSVEALLLKFVSGNLVHQADASSFLKQIDHHALAFFLYQLHGAVELLAAVAALRSEDVAGGAAGVHTHKHRLIGSPCSLEDGHMLQSVAFLPEGDDAEMSVFCGQVGFLAFLHERLFLQSVGDDVLDLYQPDSQLLGFFHQLRHSCHRAVGIEDLNERCGGTESCQPGQVDGSLGVSCPAQYAVVLGIQGVDVSRATEGLRSGSRVGQCLDGGSTVMGGHTGCASLQLVDRHGERGAKH